MKIAVTLLLLIASTSFPVRLANGQTQSPQQPDEVLRIRTNEVRLDIVVKDKKGRPINALTASPGGVGQAIEGATGASLSSYASSAAKSRDLADRSNVLDQQISSPGAAAAAAGAARDSAGAGAAGAPAGQAAAEQLFIQ